MRYVGSKAKLSKEIMPFINKALKVFPNGMYIEPFVGGCNMIDKVKHHTRIGCDANKYLIELLKLAQSDPGKIIESECFSRQAYKYIKSNTNLFHEWYVGLIGIMPTYNNQWYHSFYNDIDSSRFPNSKKCLLNQDLNGIQLVNCDYKHIPIGTGNVIYCDPPYKIEDYYKIPFEHEEFYEWVREISRNNIVFVSEYVMPSDFTCIWQKIIKPGINSTSRHKIEKLFIYKQ